MATERTPLLSSSRASSSTAVDAQDPIVPDASALAAESVGADGIGPSSSVSTEDDKPLPKVQIGLLAACRFIESVMFFVIFPFISEMIVRVGGIEEVKVGFWAGLIESLFSLTQVFVMIPWGLLSDRIGRKPVLVISMLGLSTAQLFFGLANDLKSMIIFRCLAGVFAGTAVTVRTMVSENSTQKTQARTFSLWAFAGNIGITLGPLIGGPLADAATNFGGIFERISIIRDHPYALPCFVAGGLGYVATLTSLLFLKETLPANKGEKKEKPPGILTLLKAPGVAHVVGLQFNILIVGFGFTAIAPVFWFIPVPLGGFGFSPAQISLLLSLTGICQALWLLLFFPWLQRLRGTKSVLVISSWLFAVWMVIPPFMNTLLRNGLDDLFWALIFPTTVLGTSASMAYTAIQLAINDVCPDPRLMGALNGFILSLMSATRAVCPALFASLYAKGVEDQIFAGYLAWVILFVFCAIMVVNSGFLHPKADGKKDVVVEQSKTPTANGETDREDA
ncbi:MFS general substrate transporter [Atractiella rhizophila]|nr:MFS general substrate transporter [Atractiella rhizophila]